MIEVIIDLATIKMKPSYIKWDMIVGDKLREAGVPVISETGMDGVSRGTLKRFEEENNKAMVRYTWEDD